MLGRKPAMAWHILNSIWHAVPLRSPLEHSKLVKRELFKPKTLPHCGGLGVNDLPLPCVWPGAAFGQRTIFYCTSGIMLKFSYGTGRRVNVTLWARLGPSCSKSKTGDPTDCMCSWVQVRLCHWCITERNAGNISVQEDAQRCSQMNLLFLRALLAT